MSEGEVAELVELARDAAVLEVGTYLGHSAVAMAAVATVVHTVDWHRGDPHAGDEDTVVAYLQNLTDHGVRDKVVAHIGRSEVILPLLEPASFDLVFLDAYHTVEATRSDILAVDPLIRRGGLLALHDYGDPRFGVTEAVDEAVAAGRFQVVGRVESLAVLR
jgi:predicted O-methyltransferase YrrM